MWVEIMRHNKRNNEWKIHPRPPEEFEVRVCVFDTRNIKLVDGGIADVFIRAFFDMNDECKETDTHFRC
jgi:hypothetical protein